MSEEEKTIEFTEEAVKRYLDETIKHWRNLRDTTDESGYLKYYIDAFQSVRTSLFGKVLE